MEISFDPTVIAVILGLVEFVKSLGVTGKGSLVASLALGLLLGAGAELSAAGQPGDFAGWFRLALVGLAYGLSASGLYDVGKRFLMEPRLK